MKAIFVAVVLVLVSAGVWAESLEEYQQIAMSGRELLKEKQAELDRRNLVVKQRFGNFLPSFDLEYLMTRYEPEYYTGEMDRADLFEGRIKLNVFNGMNDFHSFKSAKSARDASEYMLRSAELDLKLDVALKYLDVYRKIEQLKVAEEERRLYRDRYRQVEMKYKVGVLKKTDLMKIDVELVNALQKERTARSALDESVNVLSFVTGVDVDRDLLSFSFIETLPERSVFLAYESHEAELIQKHSAVAVLKRLIDAATFSVKAANAGYYPKSDLLVAYGSQYRDAYFWESSDNHHDEFRVELNVSVNLFDGFKKGAVRGQAKKDKEILQHRLYELQSDLTTILKNTLLDLNVSYDNLEVADSGVVEAEENLRVVDLAFGQGLATSTDVLDAIFFLSRARFNRIDAHTKVFENSYILKRLVETI